MAKASVTGLGGLEASDVLIVAAVLGGAYFLSKATSNVVAPITTAENDLVGGAAALNSDVVAAARTFNNDITSAGGVIANDINGIGSSFNNFFAIPGNVVNAGEADITSAIDGIKGFFHL